jgi:hypothetical protein
VKIRLAAAASDQLQFPHERRTGKTLLARFPFKGSEEPVQETGVVEQNTCFTGIPEGVSIAAHG